MREVISIHVGQAGVQIGNACCKSPLSTPFNVCASENAFCDALKFIVEVHRWALSDVSFF